MSYATGLLLLLVCAYETHAQLLTGNRYQARVVTEDRYRVQGILTNVTATHVHIDDEQVPLVTVRKIIIRRANRRGAALNGAIIGGLTTGFLSIRSNQKSRFQSPILFGLSLTMTAAIGAGAGALAGYAIGPINRRVIRPIVAAPNEVAENLRRQLDPFTSRSQQDVLNRVQP
ncbi:hypothetical protein [Spirosoma montaniterrae]|uniref:Glycine zipper domain-containing protein n=1 Tax=Spirosoma montaniterrae TaxID=1178516 RepID=A0A1P9WRV5_9BACT|nr:hypothetical protein [Spirosoma montaniterrae]AQG78116.1 hypothetical protein AWR27_01360 [Spirosoma montaniterrae]